MNGSQLGFRTLCFGFPAKMLYFDACFFFCIKILGLKVIKRHEKPDNSYHTEAFLINCNPNETCKWYNNNLCKLMVVIK